MSRKNPKATKVEIAEAKKAAFDVAVKLLDDMPFLKSMMERPSSEPVILKTLKSIGITGNQLDRARKSIASRNRQKESAGGFSKGGYKEMEGAMCAKPSKQEAESQRLTKPHCQDH